ncbi:MAG: aldo/keto reductase [Phycisphaeraceae bacterium]|nr:aldo/keto reductase [Phycisphaeraceae bacterium]
MQQIDFRPLGRRVSCLGFGCARLDGRVGLRRSAKLLETALELGINYFDVAASYGAAEEALGHVLGNSRDVVVATKVGPPEPPYNLARMRIKTAVRPIVDSLRGLKALLRRAATPAPQTPATRPRYDFSPQRIEHSLEQSRKRLRRDVIDVFLAHEPHRLDLGPELDSTMQSLLDRGVIRAYGVGIGAREDQWAPFGSIWQSGWPDARISQYPRRDDCTRVLHGVLRYAEMDHGSGALRDPGELIRAARRAAPDCVLLVSASTPGRLRQLVRALDEAD